MIKQLVRKILGLPEPTVKTSVLFRKYKNGEVIALFPGIKHENKPGIVWSYMHVGGHGTAKLDAVIHITSKPTIEEYLPLKAELESLGYDLYVLKGEEK